VIIEREPLGFLEEHRHHLMKKKITDQRYHKLINEPGS